MAAGSQPPRAGGRENGTPGWPASAPRAIPARPDRGRLEIAREKASPGVAPSFGGRESSPPRAPRSLDASSPSRSLIAPDGSRTLPRSSSRTDGNLAPGFNSREPSTPQADVRRNLPASPRVDSRWPTVVEPDGSRRSLSPRTPSGLLSNQRLPAAPGRAPSRPSIGDSRPSRQEGPSWAPPPSGSSGRSVGGKAPVVQRVLESIRGNRQATPVRPPAAGLSRSPSSGGSLLRQPSPPGASAPSSRSFGAAPRVSTPPRSSPPSVSRPGGSSPQGRSSASSSSSSKSGRSSSSSRSQSRSKTKPPG